MTQIYLDKKSFSLLKPEVQQIFDGNRWDPTNMTKQEPESRMSVLQIISISGKDIKESEEFST